MGSLRNPIGPLPSSIYWRRRAVALSVLALLALLVVWALGFGGDGTENRSSADGGGGSGPTDSITPGPTSSGPAISDRPGGREEADGGAGSGGGSEGSGGGEGGGDGEGDAGGGDSGGAGGGGKGGDSGALAGASGSITGGGGIPAGASVPDCDPDKTEVKLRSVENEYEPGRTPEFVLTVENGDDAACRVDLGRGATGVTITDSDDDTVWSSGHCPAGSSSAYVRVPGEGKLTQDLEWDRERSRPECRTPDGGSVKAGTYLVEATIEGFPTARTSFVLTKD